MKAMIFAAGLGTRLRPLTNDRPKALVEFKGKPLLEHTIEKLRAVGVDEVIVNVHHFADKVIDFSYSKDFGVKIIISDEREQLLDTGGGLLKAKNYLNDAPFFIHNVDILSDVDLSAMLNEHKKRGGIATIGVRTVDSERYFMKNSDDLLCAWGNQKTGEQIVSRHSEVMNTIGFTGILIIEPAFFDYINAGGPISIIDAYLKASASQDVYCFSCDDALWMDVGTPEALKEAVDLF